VIQYKVINHGWVFLYPKGEFLMGNKLIATLCPCNMQNNCPQIFSNQNAEKDHQITITDDFGGSIHMSADHLQKFITMAKEGEIKLS